MSGTDKALTPETLRALGDGAILWATVATTDLEAHASTWEAQLAAAIEENDRLFDAIRDSRNSLLDIVNDMPIKSRWWKHVVRACGPLTDAVSARTERRLPVQRIEGMTRTLAQSERED